MGKITGAGPTNLPGAGVAPSSAIALAKQMHAAATGARWPEATRQLNELRDLLAKEGESLPPAEQQVVAKRLCEAHAAAERANAWSALETIGGILALGVPFVVDALTTNDHERFDEALEQVSYAKPPAATTPVNVDMPIVDLHADTAMAALDLGPAARPFGQKILEALMPHSTRAVTMHTFAEQRAGGVQVFTAYEEGLPPFARLSHKFYTQVVCNGLKGANRTPVNQLVAQLMWIHGQVQKHQDRLELTGPSPQATRAAFADGNGEVRADPKHAIHIGIEGARIASLDPDDAKELAAFLAANKQAIPAGMPIPTRAQLATLEGRLDFLAQAGVTYMGLVHMEGTEFAGTDMPVMKQLHQLGHGTNGLTEQGQRLVRGMDCRGILIDLAHASVATQRELGELYRKGELRMPLIVSHGVLDFDGNQRWRDTPPETLALVRESGGVFGVMFALQYWDKTLGGAAGIVDQIEKAIDLAGIDHVALGSDADGFVSLALDDMGKVSTVVAELEQRGYSREQLEKICYKNFLSTLEKRQARLAIGSGKGKAALDAGRGLLGPQVADKAQLATPGHMPLSLSISAMPVAQPDPDSDPDPDPQQAK